MILLILFIEVCCRLCQINSHNKQLFWTDDKLCKEYIILFKDVLNWAYNERLFTLYRHYGFRPNNQADLEKNAFKLLTKIIEQHIPAFEVSDYINYNEIIKSPDYKISLNIASHLRCTARKLGLLPELPPNPFLNFSFKSTKRTPAEYLKIEEQKALEFQNFIIAMHKQKEEIFHTELTNFKLTSPNTTIKKRQK